MSHSPALQLTHHRMQLLGVDADLLTQNIIILDCLYVAAVALALGAMALRVHLLRRGYAT
jgi:hypothetical protein